MWAIMPLGRHLKSRAARGVKKSMDVPASGVSRVAALRRSNRLLRWTLIGLVSYGKDNVLGWLLLLLAAAAAADDDDAVV